MEFKTITLLRNRTQQKAEQRKLDRERKNNIREESIFAYKLKNDFDEIQSILRKESTTYVDIFVAEKDINTFLKITNSDKRYRDFKISPIGEGKYRVILLYT